jgi:hypothetical protein
MDKPLLNQQQINDFADFLCNPIFQPEREEAARRLRNCTENNQVLNLFTEQTDKPHTPVAKYREVFLVNHRALLEEFGDKQIHIATIRHWWESTQPQLPGDFEKPSDTRGSEVRWWQILCNSIQDSDVFMRGKIRAHYVLRKLSAK